jgi:hypothetical protein
MSDCANLEKCGFVKKYGESKALAVNGFVKMYCKSEKQSQCKRKDYKQNNGVAPADEMLPNGGFMQE